MSPLRNACAEAAAGFPTASFVAYKTVIDDAAGKKGGRLWISEEMVGEKSFKDSSPLRYSVNWSADLLFARGSTPADALQCIVM